MSEYCNEFERAMNMATLFNEEELEALSKKYQDIIKDRERIKRNELRQELIENLQKAIGDILHNNFYLIIKNTERDHKYDDYDEVVFDPQDIYSIEIG